MILLIALTVSCKTIPVEHTIWIPDFNAQMPVRPVLEPVVLVDTVPPALLRNYSAITLYAMGYEDAYKEIVAFHKKLQEIYNK